MLKGLCLLLFVAISFHSLMAQWAGTYTATINGDLSTLVLVEKGAEISGTLEDGQQRYEVLAKAMPGNVRSMQGTAREASMGITFELAGDLRSQGINLKGQLRFLGTLQPGFEALFVPKAGGKSSAGKVEDQALSGSNASALPPAMQGRQLDPRLVRRWREESHYSSGYGSDFSGSTYQYMRINANHTMSNEGSKASISGSDYSGRSSSAQGSEVVADLWLYTEGKRLMICVRKDSKYEHAHLADYFIENGKLLLTDPRTGKRQLYFGE